MMKKIRLGVVGYGSRFYGNTLASRGSNLFRLAAESFEGVIPAGICETDPRSLDIARESFPNARHFSDFDKMLDEVPMDALFVTTPADFHSEFAVKALERDIHVLSDIPCVHTIEEARELWAAHKKSKAMYMTGANPNFKGWVDAAVDLKRRGLFGDLVYAEASYIHDLRSLFKNTPWRIEYEPIRYCTHSLGPILRLIDEDFEWVTCFDTGGHINKSREQHDVMTALLRTPSSVVVHLTVSWINNYRGGSHFSRYFTTKGCFEQTPNYQTRQKEPAAAYGRTLFYSTDLPAYKTWIELPAGTMPTAYADNPEAQGPNKHGGTDYAMLDAFFSAIRAEAPSPISLKEGLRMTLPGIYAAESALTGGKPARIRYPWTGSANLSNP